MPADDGARGAARRMLLELLDQPGYIEQLAADPPLMECYYRLGRALGLPPRAPGQPPRREPPKVYPMSGDAIAWHLILLWQDCGLQARDIARLLMRLDGTPGWPPAQRVADLLQDAGL